MMVIGVFVFVCVIANRHIACCNQQSSTTAKKCGNSYIQKSLHFSIYIKKNCISFFRCFCNFVICFVAWPSSACLPQTYRKFIAQHTFYYYIFFFKKLGRSQLKEQRTATNRIKNRIHFFTIQSICCCSFRIFFLFFASAIIYIHFHFEASLRYITTPHRIE